jgi:FtsZ-interacting cell division protein ZipA
MDNTMTWIIVAVVAIVVIAVVALLARNARNRRRHVHAERIREEVDHETPRVQKREAFADETEAKARAAKAEAEAKAAEAARLEQTAAAHRDAATTSREELDARREHADNLDPKRRDVQGPKDAEAPPMQPDTIAQERPRHEQRRS